MKLTARSPLLAATIVCLLAGAPAAFAQDTPTAPPPAPPVVAPPAAPATGAIDPAKEKSIRELLVLTGSEKMTKQVMKQMLISMRAAMPDVPEEYWVRFEKKGADTATLFNKLTAIYDRHYTQEDIDGLIAFYKSPLGQKMLQELPAVQQESITIGQEWGRNLAQQVIADIEAEQAKAKPAPKPAKPAPTGRRKP